MIMKFNIIDFEPEYATDFKRLNIAWLEKYFHVEAIDQKILSNPQDYIIDPGGKIYLAIGINKDEESEVVGTVALINDQKGNLEMSKMSVAERYQGLGIGRQLAIHAIRKFQSTSAEILYLESNSRLEPAITLYESLGFQHTRKPEPDSSYQRANVYMEFNPKSPLALAIKMNDGG